MEDQVKLLTEKVDKLQATLDYMVARMWPVYDPASVAPERPGSFIGGGELSYISMPDFNTKPTGLTDN